MRYITLFLLFTVYIFADMNIFYYQNNKKVYLSVENIGLRAISKDIKYFKTSNGTSVALNKEILVKLSDGSSIDDICKQYDLILVKNIFGNLYLVEVDNMNNTLDISNKLYNDINIEYAHPNFKRKITQR